MIFRQLANSNCSLTQTTGRRKREVTNLVPMTTAFVTDFLGILFEFFCISNHYVGNVCSLREGNVFGHVRQQFWGGDWFNASWNIHCPSVHHGMGTPHPTTLGIRNW